ncbi:DNA-3-methyladenine glycosylase [Brevibacterium sp. UMB1308A]|uniref:DNA-3-methyladenine glycosylase n=1 Tax=Brevibacterium sp. UMB1308A TaxID=3050608 RepID=UPI002549EE2E|nr:DNA-3-methyladenine glycosylase [Brevibacterium sp. UMB1308A]MDK8346856.1 DNA-3-methyladenine glycosylase [Brevibacterium sp. UMB1308B]MDK8714004.1 DNA-3-methyladenine glycosylase [Brevibacterium sp. UMB1308A]
MSVPDGAPDGRGDGSGLCDWLSPDARTSARVLLGCFLATPDVTVRITEVEAYAGVDDPASHAYKGQTARNAVMFGPAGHLYTYTMHGHTCCNVVCSPAGVAQAVLIRAGEVVDGAEVARSRRRPGVSDAHLARGPGNLTRALGVTMAHSGVDLCDRGSEVTLVRGELRASESVAVGPRVGVSQAADDPMRFWIQDDPTVSAYRRSPRAPKPSH